METVLIIIASLFGGLNIFQFIFFRAERRKRNAEADLAAVDVCSKDFELKKDQFEFLLDQLTKCQEDYYSLDQRMREYVQKTSEIINQKCNEIAELKSQLIYFKGLRCYKSDCSQRIEHKDSNNLNKDNNEKN